VRSTEFAIAKPPGPPHDGVPQGSNGHLIEHLAAQLVADFAERRSLAV